MQCPIKHHPETPAADAPVAAAPVVPKDVSLQKIIYEPDQTSATIDDWPLPEGLDLSRPMSELFRKGTELAHTQAEHSDGAVALTQGLLELKEYVRWLGYVWRVYEALETAIDENNTNSVLAPTYKPEILRRVPEIEADIKFLLTRLPSFVAKPPKRPLKATPEMPLPKLALPPFMEEVFTETPAAVGAYLNRIKELSKTDESAGLIMAHAYVRYLGDLSGGQVIGARMRKAYGLNTLDGRRFYYFDLGSDSATAAAGEETVGERKKKLNEVKNWYRRGMDEGAGEDKDLKAALVREANVAFVLNTNLFSLITPPGKSKESKERYFETRTREETRRRDLDASRKTTAETVTSTAYFIAAVLFGLFLSQVVVPKAAPYVEPYYKEFVEPRLDSALTWWDQEAYPVIRQQIVRNRRALI